jgi:O-acetylhomoserine (thiol)-lyase
MMFEQRQLIEGGIAVVTASGTAAGNRFIDHVKTGDHTASSSLYGGTFNLLNATLPRLGITTTFVDPQRKILPKPQ